MAAQPAAWSTSILKSGTNQVHGVAFEILQNTDLNANRWENNLAGQPRDPFKQNQFGGAAGGPIIKNKLFIFGDYQGTRIATAGGTIQNLGYGGFYTIPTHAMVNGDFSSLLGQTSDRPTATGLQNQIFDPTSTSCVSACTTATRVHPRRRSRTTSFRRARWIPAATKIASLYPAPNQPITAR